MMTILFVRQVWFVITAALLVHLSHLVPQPFALEPCRAIAHAVLEWCLCLCLVLFLLESRESRGVPAHTPGAAST